MPTINPLLIAVVSISTVGANGVAPTVGADDPDPDWQPL